MNNKTPIWRDANRLLVMIEKVVRDFPRYHKYIIGSEMRLKPHFQPYSNQIYSQVNKCIIKQQGYLKGRLKQRIFTQLTINKEMQLCA